MKLNEKKAQKKNKRRFPKLKMLGGDPGAKKNF